VDKISLNWGRATSQQRASNGQGKTETREELITNNGKFRESKPHRKTAKRGPQE